MMAQRGNSTWSHSYKEKSLTTHSIGLLL